jgi:hypothetical protein
MQSWIKCRVGKRSLTKIGREVGLSSIVSVHPRRVSPPVSAKYSAANKICPANNLQGSTRSTRGIVQTRRNQQRNALPALRELRPVTLGMRESAFFDEEHVDRATPTDETFVQLPSVTSSWDALPNRARSALIQFDMEEGDWRQLFPDFDNYIYISCIDRPRDSTCASSRQ